MKYNPNIHHRRSVRLRGYDYGKEGMYFITICTQHRVHFFGEVENGEMVLSPFGEIAHREWEQLSERWPHIELGAFQIMPNHMHGVLLVHRPYSTVLAATSSGATTRVAPTAAPDDVAPTVGDDIDSEGTPLVVVLNDDDTVDDTATRADPTNDENDGDSVGATLVADPNDGENASLFPPEIPFSKMQWATRPYLGQVIGAYKSIVATECLNHHKQNQPGVWLDKIWQRGFDERIIRNREAFDKISNYIINNPKNWKEDKFFE